MGEVTEADINVLVAAAAVAANDALGEDTDVFHVAEHLGITDWFIVTTGRNPRAVRAMVDKIEEALTVNHGIKPISIEGKEAAEWVLMDYGDFVVHLFGSEARLFYDLSRLWSDAPRMELDLTAV